MSIVNVFRFVTYCVIQMVMTSAVSAGWISCGNQDGNCAVPGGQPIFMRYGSPSGSYPGYFYYQFAGMTSIPCGDSYGGEPANGIHPKSCHTVDDGYSTTGLNDMVHLGDCSEQHTDCTVTSQPTWIHYGAGTRWLSSIQSGTFYCNDSTFNMDPYRGQHKSCKLGERVFGDKTPEWNVCATQENYCFIGSNSTVLLRYGFGDKWVYRLVTMPSSILCNDDRFSKDPYVGQVKQCEWAILPISAAAHTTGKWNMIANLTCTNGATCSTDIAVSYGSTHTEAYETTEEWVNTATVTMSAGIEINGVSASVEGSASSSYAHSTSYQKSLETNKTTTITNSCTQSESGTLRIYQFSTSTSVPCLNTEGCNGTTDTLNTICVSNPPSNYAGPQCVPTDCKDPQCTMCISSSN